MKRRSLATALLLGAGTLAGCLPAYRAAPPASQVAAHAAWREPVAGTAAIDAHWWRSFGDPVLASLVEAASRRNSEVLIAVARIDEARAQADAAGLGVAASTAQNYVALLALDAQLSITRETVASRAEALPLAQDQARVDYISHLQLTQAQSEYQAVLGSVPELDLAVRRQENAVRLLAGRPMK